MCQKWTKLGANPGRPASPRPAGLAPPRTWSRLRTSGNVTHSWGSESRVGSWFNWIHRKASTSIQRFTRQPKVTSISRTHFPGKCIRAEQSLGKVRGRDGPEGGRPAQQLQQPGKPNCQPTPGRDQSRCPKGGGHVAATPGGPA